MPPERIFMGGVMLSGLGKARRPSIPAAGGCTVDSNVFDWLAINFCATRTKSTGSLPSVGGALEAFNFVKSIRGQLRGGPMKEHFIVICLDSQMRAIGVAVVSVGSVSAALVHPRETFQPAVMLSAKAVILSHTHPSGNPTPSDDDNALTRRLVAAGDILGIAVLDHVVAGDEDYYSYAEQGRLRT